MNPITRVEYDGWVPCDVVHQLSTLFHMMSDIKQESDFRARIRKIGQLFRFLNDVHDTYAQTSRSILHVGEIYRSLKKSANAIMEDGRTLDNQTQVYFISEAQNEILTFLSH